MMPAERAKHLIIASFGRHFLVFLAVCIGSLALAAATDWRWLYGVALGWGGFILLHFLLYKAATVDWR